MKNKSKTVSENQIQECLRNAHGFLKCAKLAIGYEDESIQVERLISSDLNACVVNSALACELFLKAICAMESACSAMPVGHELVGLYNGLPASSRRVIEDSCAELDSKKFEEFLCEASTAFVDWRYSHEEYRTIHPLFLIELGSALSKFADTLCSQEEWRPAVNSY